MCLSDRKIYSPEISQHWNVSEQTHTNDSQKRRCLTLLDKFYTSHESASSQVRRGSPRTLSSKSEFRSRTLAFALNQFSGSRETEERTTPFAAAPVPALIPQCGDRVPLRTMTPSRDCISFLSFHRSAGGDNLTVPWPGHPLPFSPLL